MATTSKIAWTEQTWNPTVGCDKVSPGCVACYAIRQARMRSNNPDPKIRAAYAGVVDRDDDGALDWTGTVNLLPDRLDTPLRWRAPRRVFVDSMSDLFHKEVPDEFIAQVFAVMAVSAQHTFQLLTKRHGRMRALLNDDAFVEQIAQEIVNGNVHDGWPKVPLEPGVPWWPLPNLWLGVSVEDQQRANLRVPALLDTPAAVHWLSLEPLLGPIDLQAADRDVFVDGGLDWLVIGGESGPGARPLQLDWIRSLIEQGHRHPAGQVFVKQLGEVWAQNTKYLGRRVYDVDRKGDDPAYWPADLRIRDYPTLTGLGGPRG